MVEEKFSQKIRLKKIDETRNYSVENRAKWIVE